MLPDSKVKCPATGFARSCRSIVSADDCTCPKFVSIRGVDPQGGEVEQWGCVDSFMPMLMIENSKRQLETGAAIESFRNEMVDGNKISQQLLTANLMGVLPAKLINQG